MPAPLILLLPGLDGTARLFEPFMAAAPSGLAFCALALPQDRPRRYDELADWVIAQLPSEPVALVAESFSGPLALLVADRAPNVAKVALCASFVQAPLPRLMTRLPSPLLRMPLPVAFLQAFLTGGNARLAAAVQSATSSVPHRVLASRIAAVGDVDVTPELARYRRPLLWLRAERDRLIPARCTTPARAIRPEATYADVDAPHLLLQAQPHLAWRALLPFLSASQDGAGSLPNL